MPRRKKQDERRPMTAEELKNKHREAGLKSAITKGPEERIRTAKMAAWTRKHGNDPARNPFTKENYARNAHLTES